MAFAYEKTMENSIRFVLWVFEHLKSLGIDVSNITVQTDWGIEFAGPTHQKTTSPFVKLIENIYQANHQTIPVAAPKFNGSVDNFLGRIEDELYYCHHFTCEKDLLDKTASYLIYYHFR